MAFIKETFTQATTTAYGTNTKWFAEKIAELISSFGFTEVEVVTDTTDVYNCILYGSSTPAIRIHNATSNTYMAIGSYSDGTFTSRSSHSESYLNYNSAGYTMSITTRKIDECYLDICCDNTYTAADKSWLCFAKLVSQLDQTENIAVHVSDKACSIPATVTYTQDANATLQTIGTSYPASVGTIDDDMVVLSPVVIYSDGFNMGIPKLGDRDILYCSGRTITAGKIYTIGGKRYFGVGYNKNMLVGIDDE